MRLSRSRVAVACLAVALAACAAAAPAARAQTLIQPESSAGIAGWTETGSSNQDVLTAGEGVATVTQSGGTTVLYRGAASIPASLAAQGWTHIGDPDSADGYIIDAYQGSSSGNTKMDLLTTPSGSAYQYTHTLAPGELYNNSFAAISPDTQWLVSGDWGTQSHLDIYNPAPYFNSQTGQTGGTLPLAGDINLSNPGQRHPGL